MTGDLARLAINQVTTKTQWNLREAIEGYAAAGVHGIAVWPDKLAECGVAEARRLLDDHGMTVTGYCRGGMFAATDPAELRRLHDENRRMLDEAAAIGARCLVCVVGGLPPGSRDLAGARARAEEELARLLSHAIAVGVPLGIEPLHPMLAAHASCINTLAQANDLCARLGTGSGIVVDAHHVWWDPDLQAQVTRAAGTIVAFHVSDWLVPADGIITGRGMMGDGVIELARIRRLVEAAFYDGYCEVEIMSPLDWWRRPGEEVVRTCIARYRAVC
jgi:sugar phosphate isomerase/epimerase